MCHAIRIYKREREMKREKTTHCFLLSLFYSVLFLKMHFCPAFYLFLEVQNSGDSPAHPMLGRFCTRKSHAKYKIGRMPRRQNFPFSLLSAVNGAVVIKSPLFFFRISFLFQIWLQPNRRHLFPAKGRMYDY